MVVLVEEVLGNQVILVVVLEQQLKVLMVAMVPILLVNTEQVAVAVQVLLEATVLVLLVVLVVLV